PAVPLANRWCWIGFAGGGTASIKSALVDRFLLPCPYQTDGAGLVAPIASVRSGARNCMAYLFLLAILLERRTRVQRSYRGARIALEFQTLRVWQSSYPYL
ncbi:hypothetical protein, partial [Microseira wollei]|uniref:hypothetical protein n=1 Tax=Microseira wollei TaxID=467598 RepID=UPI001CFDE731